MVSAEQVGAADGFNADPEIHIPLPDYMRDVQSALELIGAGQMGQDLELKLNFQVIENGALFGGYRDIELDTDAGDADVYDSFFLGVSLTF